MLTRQARYLISLLGIVLMLTGTAAGAAEAQGGLERDEGVVNSIDLRTNTLIVDDKPFTLTDDTQVRSAGGAQATLLDLTAGTPVRIDFQLLRHGTYARTRLIQAVTIVR